MSDLDVRIRAARRAAAAARATVRPRDTADQAAAVSTLTEGLWPTLRIYIDARSDGVRLDDGQLGALDAAVADWLTVYAAQFGESIEPEVPIRSVAETFLDTHDLTATAAIHTGVPDTSRIP